MNHEVKKELNNKGFSLMELIIVVAIMAVLIGVLAPQYLKYVEKSRQSADLQAIDTLISAVEIYSASTSVTGELVCSDSTVTTDDDGLKKAFEDAGITMTGTKVATMKSDKYKSWTITFSASEVSVNDGDLAAALSIKLTEGAGGGGTE